MEQGHEDIITNIRQKCLQFYITAAEDIRKRLPINNVFLKKLQIFQPQIALFDINREMSFNDVLFIAKTLSKFDENDLKEEWFALHADYTNDEKQTLATMNLVICGKIF